MNSLLSFSPKQLRRAAEIQEEIQALQNELRDLDGISAKAPDTKTKVKEPKKKRTVSAAAKAKMRKSQKARWAKIKADKAAPAKV